MAIGRLLLLCVAIGAATAYYVPGTYPQEFYVGDHLQGLTTRGNRIPCSAHWVLFGSVAHDMRFDFCYSALMLCLSSKAYSTCPASAVYGWVATSWFMCCSACQLAHIFRDRASIRILHHAVLQASRGYQTDSQHGQLGDHYDGVAH